MKSIAIVYEHEEHSDPLTNVLVYGDWLRVSGCKASLQFCECAIDLVREGRMELQCRDKPMASWPIPVRQIIGIVDDTTAVEMRLRLADLTFTFEDFDSNRAGPVESNRYN